MSKSKDTKKGLTPDTSEVISGLVRVEPEFNEGVTTSHSEAPEFGYPKTNVAIVEVNGKEVRKYTLKVHGPEFKKLANEYASHTKGAEVKLVLLEKGVICPACGHEFHP
jgi:hypothetical protein